MESCSTFGIGTDGASCADGLNMFESLRRAPLVSHVTSTDPERWLSARDAFRMPPRQSEAIVVEHRETHNRATRGSDHLLPV